MPYSTLPQDNNYYLQKIIHSFAYELLPWQVATHPPQTQMHFGGQQ